MLPLKAPIGHVTLLVFLFWPIAADSIAGGAQVRFAVATWNVRSGHGAAPAQPNPPFDMNSPHCEDPLRPRNAWGVGFMQQFLQADVSRDPLAVALAVQEAWGTCGSVKNIAAQLGWRYPSPERAGVGLIARYGIVGPWDSWQI